MMTLYMLCCVLTVCSGHPRPRSVSLRSSHRRRVRSHPASLRSFAWRRQSFRLHTCPLDVTEEGSDAQLSQGDVARRRDSCWADSIDRSATVPAGRCSWHDRSSTSQRPDAASWPLRRVAAAGKYQRLHQCRCVATSAKHAAVCQSTRQPKRH